MFGLYVHNSIEQKPTELEFWFFFASNFLSLIIKNWSKLDFWMFFFVIYSESLLSDNKGLSG